MPLQIASATRIHRRNDPNRFSSPVPGSLLSTLQSYLQNAKEYADFIFVAYDAEDALLAESIQNLIANSPENATKIQMIAVRPWGNFVPALNALVSSTSTSSDVIVFQSAEVVVPAYQAHHLATLATDERTLVAGKRLPGQIFNAGSNELTGRTSPWNTLAAWNVSQLSRTGFMLVSEGLCGTSAGVEECATIAVQQTLFPDIRAILVDFADADSGSGWNTEFESEERKEWHETKMRSKEERAKGQLDVLGVKGTVEHIVYSAN